MTLALYLIRFASLVTLTLGIILLTIFLARHFVEYLGIIRASALDLIAAARHFWKG